MKTPSQYKNILAALDVEKIKAEVTDPAEVQEFLARLDIIQGQLKDIETSINFDIHALRSQYQGKLASLNHNPRRKGRVEEEQHVEDKQEEKLAPYQEVKAEVQALLAELDEKRDALAKRPSGA